VPPEQATTRKSAHLARRQRRLVLEGDPSTGRGCDSAPACRSARTPGNRGPMRPRPTMRAACPTPACQRKLALEQSPRARSDRPPTGAARRRSAAEGQVGDAVGQHIGVFDTAIPCSRRLQIDRVDPTPKLAITPAAAALRSARDRRRSGEVASRRIRAARGKKRAGPLRATADAHRSVASAASRLAISRPFCSTRGFISGSPDRGRPPASRSRSRSPRCCCTCFR